MLVVEQLSPKAELFVRLCAPTRNLVKAAHRSDAMTNLSTMSRLLYIFFLSSYCVNVFPSCPRLIFHSRMLM